MNLTFLTTIKLKLCYKFTLLSSAWLLGLWYTCKPIQRLMITKLMGYTFEHHNYLVQIRIEESVDDFFRMYYLLESMINCTRTLVLEWFWKDDQALHSHTNIGLFLPMKLKKVEGIEDLNLIITDEWVSNLNLYCMLYAKFNPCKTVLETSMQMALNYWLGRALNKL